MNLEAFKAGFLRLGTTFKAKMDFITPIPKMLHEIPYHHFSPLSPSKRKMRIDRQPPTPSTIINFTIHLTSFMDFLKRYTIQT